MKPADKIRETKEVMINGPELRYKNSYIIGCIVLSILFGTLTYLTQNLLLVIWAVGFVGFIGYAHGYFYRKNIETGEKE
jgi:hypothetical protein